MINKTAQALQVARDFIANLADFDATYPPGTRPLNQAAELLLKLDAAFQAEIERISTLEYNSNEICRHFYGQLRERFATLYHAPASEQPAPNQGMAFPALSWQQLAKDARARIMIEQGTGHEMLCFNVGAFQQIVDQLSKRAPASAYDDQPAFGLTEKMFKAAGKCISEATKPDTQEGAKP